MASFRAMKDLAENADAVRALARGLRSLGASAAVRASPAQMRARETVEAVGQPVQPSALVEWTDWELDFLDSLVERHSTEPLSMRQREKLFELKSAVERFSTFEGFSVKALIERAFAVRFDLDDEEDQTFLADLRAAATATVSRRQLYRLLSCCRVLGVIERYQGLDG